jgi:lysyl-tRNA synthetase class 2
VSSETIPGRLGVWRPRAAATAVWYLRIAAVLNLFGAVSAPFRGQVTRRWPGSWR